MTDAERNLGVAEACGWDVVCYPGHNPRFVLEHGRLMACDPLHDANQALDALYQKFARVETKRDRDLTVVKGWLDGREGRCLGEAEDPDPRLAFCQAAALYAFDALAAYRRDYPKETV